MTTATGTGSVEVEIRAIASGGDGIGELPDGRVVFVPRTAPGDRVRISVEQDRSSWARASLVEVLEAGETRVEAPCPLYDRCGGCQLQHLPYEAQRRWKGRFVVDALERIGKLEDVPEPEVVASPRTEGYRTRMTFTLRRLRGGRVVAGLHALERAGHVVDVDDECLLPRDEVLQAWTALRRAWGSGAHRLPDGGRMRLTLRGMDVGVELVVDGGAPGWRSGGLMDDVAALSAIWHRPSDAEELTLVAGASVPGGGDAFEQVNPEAAAALYAHVFRVASELLGAPDGAHAGVDGAEARLDGADSSDTPAAPASVVDAYCGAAAVGRELAAAGHRVTGIELNPSAVEAARFEAPEGISVVEGRVEERLSRHLPCDLLLLNPPRTGLDESLPDAILESPPAHLVYVSCDAATLARDVALLGDAYALTALRCFDLFPHTAHVETVAVLRAREAS